MYSHFEILTHVGQGAVDFMGPNVEFTSREFGEILHESQQYCVPHERYRKPLRRGATAGAVLHQLKLRGFVERTGRTGGWRTLR